MYSKSNCVLFLMSGIILHQIHRLASDDYTDILQGRYSHYFDTGDEVTMDYCNEDTYQCANDKCIKRTSLCDGIVNCLPEADDEQNCQRCQEGFYKCNSGPCIPEEFICDGKNDCGEHGDDEEDCEVVNICAKTKAECTCKQRNTINCDSKNLISLPHKINETITKFDFRNNKLGLFGNLSNSTFSRYSWINELNLNNNEINYLPPKIFENLNGLWILRLSSNKIRFLDEDIFKNLPHLWELDLSSNRITKLPEKVFSNPNLLYLYLHSNEIRNIEDFVFSNLTNLKMLNLSSNSIAKLTSHVFSNLSKLEVLDITSNSIETIANDTFHSLGNLLYLDLTKNKVSTLTSTMLKKMRNLRSLVLSFNKITTIGSKTFNNGGGKLEYLYLDNNRITKLNTSMFWGTGLLKELKLESNLIHTIEKGTFADLFFCHILDLSANNLTIVKSNMFPTDTKIYYDTLKLNNNSISDIEDSAFNRLNPTTSLYLEFNNIQMLTSNIFKNLNNLKLLNLHSNNISIIDDSAFNSNLNLEYLYLNSNRIETLTSTMFRRTSDLKMIFLQDNKITSIEDFTFKKLKNLMILNLSSNKITRLSSYVFQGLDRLRALFLQSNKITTIERNTFYGLPNLIILNLQHNEIEDVDENILKYSISLKNLSTDEYRFCCMKKNLSTCTPSPDQFSSCDDLMANYLLLISIWILGVIAIFANSYVIIFRSGQKNANLNKINSFLIKNLATSDLFMGIYLLIIAFVDFFYRGKYYMYDFKWRKSSLCNFAGFMSTFSSELTVFTLIVIAIDRLLSIKSPARSRLQEIKPMRILMAAVWILAAILALIPLPFFNIDYFKNFYGRSGVCLPLHITNDKANGWEYSVFIFIILNAISFAIITLSYVLSYWFAKQSSKTITRSFNRPSNTAMAFRVTMLISINAACWLPIITLGLSSLMGNTISPNVYAWIAVFVLPLNAALNPILYTISQKPVVISYQRKDKRFKRRLGLRWPCYWKEKTEQVIAPLKTEEIVPQ